MIFGKTWDEHRADERAYAQYRLEQAKRGKFVLVPRRLASGRWAWLERLPYRDEIDYTWDRPRMVRTYYAPGTVLDA